YTTHITLFFIYCIIFIFIFFFLFFFFFSSRRRHTRSKRDWSSDVCSSDLPLCNLIGGGRQACFAPHSAHHLALESVQNLCGDLVVPEFTGLLLSQPSHHPAEEHRRP